MFFLYDGKLNDLDLKVAKRIEDNPQYVINHNIYQTAELIGISPSKLTKYCQKIKLSGFKELKYKIQTNIQQVTYLKRSEQMEDFTVLLKFIDLNTIGNLYLIPKLIDECEKILIICGSYDIGLGNYFTLKLRKYIDRPIFTYPVGANYNHEFASGAVLSIVIDTTNTIQDRDIVSLRPTDKYIHFGNTQVSSISNYIPILFTDNGSPMPFDSKLCLVISWIINYKLFLD